MLILGSWCLLRHPQKGLLPLKAAVLQAVWCAVECVASHKGHRISERFPSAEVIRKNFLEEIDCLIEDAIMLKI